MVKSGGLKNLWSLRQSWFEPTSPHCVSSNMKGYFDIGIKDIPS